VLAYSDPGDLVVDPCCAAGSVLVEAIRHGRRAVGITSDPRLGALAVANINHARDQGAPGPAAVLEGAPTQLPRLLNKAATILNPDPGAHKLRRHPAGSTRLILTATPADEIPELLPVLHTVLAPGGFLLLALDQHHHATRIGLGATVAAAEDAGLHYWQHVIALRTPPTTKPSDRPVLLHTDVLAFRKPVPARVNNRIHQAVNA
jgi:tRNA G10  N-methylase Trm11